MTATELKACAHCGGDAFIENEGKEDEYVWCGRQVFCGCTVNGVNKWNKRTPDPRLKIAVDALEDIIDQFPVDYDIRITEIAKQAIAKIKKESV